jgi:hypothetical protein
MNSRRCEEVCFVEVNALTKTQNVELKPLPSSLRYEFLGPDETYQVIVNADIDSAQTDKLLGKLRKQFKAIRYTIDDLVGISSAICIVYTSFRWRKDTN